MNYYWNRNDEIEDENISEIEDEPWKQGADYQAAEAAFDKALAALHKARAYDQGFYGPELHDDGREWQRLSDLKRSGQWLSKDDYIKYMRLEDKRLGVLPRIREAEVAMTAATNAKIAAIQRYMGGRSRVEYK